MGDGKNHSGKEMWQKELRKHAALALSLTVKLVAIWLYSLFLYSPFARAHPLITKIITGVLASLVIGWIVSYFKRRLKRKKTSLRDPIMKDV